MTDQERRDAYRRPQDCRNGVKGNDSLNLVNGEKHVPLSVRETVKYRTHLTDFLRKEAKRRFTQEIMTSRNGP